MEYLLIFISAIFVNNIVLSQFLGICPFLGVSKKVETAKGMGLAVTFVLVIATIVTYLLQVWVLNPFGLQYLQTIVFILVIAALVQMVEIVLKKLSPSLYQALGVFLPLITTNCCILGVAILVANGTYNAQGLEANLLTGIIFALATALGFALSLIVFAGLREQLSLVRVPKGMDGMPIISFWQPVDSIFYGENFEDYLETEFLGKDQCVEHIPERMKSTGIWYYLIG